MDASSFQLAVIRFQKEEGDEKKIIHMDIPDGQDGQDKSLKRREPRMNANKNKRKNFSHRGAEKKIGLDSRLPPRLRGKDEGWVWELGVYIY